VSKDFFNKINNGIVPANAMEMRVRINDRLMPTPRGEIYDDPFDEFLQVNGYGRVFDVGTKTSPTNEIEYSIIEFYCYKNKIYGNAVVRILDFLEELGAPKGSRLDVPLAKATLPFGAKNGLAIYLDGVNLPKEIYQATNVNEVYNRIKQLVGDKTKPEHQRAQTLHNETVLCFYSNLSFERMKEVIKDFVETYPLCKNARIVQIA